jgi:hypothetical protein
MKAISSKMSIELPDEIVKLIYYFYRVKYLNNTNTHKFRFREKQLFLLGRTHIGGSRYIIRLNSVKRYIPKYESNLIYLQKAVISFTLFYIYNTHTRYFNFNIDYISDMYCDDKMWSNDYCWYKVLTGHNNYYYNLFNYGKSLKEILIYHIGYNDGLLLSKLNCFYSNEPISKLLFNYQNKIPRFINYVSYSKNVYENKEEHYTNNPYYKFDNLYIEINQNSNYTVFLDEHSNIINMN